MELFTAYVLIGVLVSVFQIDSMLLWAQEQYPTIRKEYLKSLPKTYQGKMVKLMAMNIYGVIVVLTVLACQILWIPLVIEYLLKKTGVIRRG